MKIHPQTLQELIHRFFSFLSEDPSVKSALLHTTPPLRAQAVFTSLVSVAIAVGKRTGLTKEMMIEAVSIGYDRTETTNPTLN